MAFEPRYIVAVDGGGSGCRVRIVDRHGRKVASATAGPANINTDFDAAQDNILVAITKAYIAADLKPDQRNADFAFLGLAGANRRKLSQKMETALGFPTSMVVTDIETTVEGATGGKNGTVALLGTGSFFVQRCRGKEQRIGGWGYQLADECSGAWLGRELLRSTLQAHDGLHKHSDLTQSVLDRFDGAPGEIVGFANSAHPGEIAQMAPEIAAAHQSGDATANRIVGEALRLLCQRLDAFIPKQNEVLDLFILGGLASFYTPLLPERYRNLLRNPHGDALDGAIALASKSLPSILAKGRSGGN